MNENKGAKGGTRDSRLYRFFLKLLKKKKEDALEERLASLKIKNLTVKKDLDKFLFNKKRNLNSNQSDKVINTNKINKRENIKEEDKIDQNRIYSSIIKEDNKTNHSSKGKDKKINEKIVLPNKEKNNLDKSKVVEKNKNVEDNLIKKSPTNLEIKVENDSKETDISNSQKIDKEDTVTRNNNTDRLIDVVVTKEENNKNDWITENAASEKEDRNTDKVNFDDVAKKEENVTTEDKQKEIQEIILEESILNYLDRILKDNQYKLNKLLSEYELIKKDTEKLNNYDDSVLMSKEVDKLIDRINKIKKDLELLSTSINLDNSYKFDDSYISFLIEEYRNKYNNDYDMIALNEIRNKSEYKSIMAKLYDIEKTANNLEQEVNYKMIEIKENENDFNLYKLSINKNQEAFKDIESMINNSNYMLKDLEDKINNSKHIVERVEYITKSVNNNLGTLLLGYLAVKNNPLVPTTVKALMLTNLVLGGIENMFGKTEKKVYNEVIIDNYERELLNGINNIDNVFSLIDDTTNRVNSIKIEFVNRFYGYDIPEYSETLNKLDTLLQNINERRDYLVKTKADFNQQLEKNNQKVKELRYDDDNIKDNAA